MVFKAFIVSITLSVASSAAAAGRPITPADLLSLARISDPQLSPDGTRVLYTVAVPDMAANRTARNIWIVSTTGGDARQLTTTGRDGGARWSPDGKTIAFTSSRSGGTQLYLMNADGTGEPRQDRKSVV